MIHTSFLLLLFSLLNILKFVNYYVVKDFYFSNLENVLDFENYVNVILNFDFSFRAHFHSHRKYIMIDFYKLRY